MVALEERFAAAIPLARRRTYIRILQLISLSATYFLPGILWIREIAHEIRLRFQHAIIASLEIQARSFQLRFRLLRRRSTRQVRERLSNCGSYYVTSCNYQQNFHYSDYHFE